LKGGINELSKAMEIVYYIYKNSLDHIIYFRFMTSTVY
jgi:hypothetical protein